MVINHLLTGMILQEMVVGHLVGKRFYVSFLVYLLLKLKLLGFDLLCYIHLIISPSPSSSCSYFIFPTLCCFPLCGKRVDFFPTWLLKRWKRNQAILLRRISGGRITATGRKTNGMKYATKAAVGFFWVVGKLWYAGRDQKPTVGWVGPF